MESKKEQLITEVVYQGNPVSYTQLTLPTIRLE